jgi:hypothetical protein
MKKMSEKDQGNGSTLQGIPRTTCNRRVEEMMNQTPQAADAEKPEVIIEKIELFLEERKSRKDRRQNPQLKFPSCLERRSGIDRRTGKPQ